MLLQKHKLNLRHVISIRLPAIVSLQPCGPGLVGLFSAQTGCLLGPLTPTPNLLMGSIWLYSASLHKLVTSDIVSKSCLCAIVSEFGKIFNVGNY